ncbi:hypothetical protein [Microbacterium thalassium]|uniref:Uncharacterized protein n=1 Tax=Microbacterium thalassium TaxID=362649 RepID=A0A7X0FN07_9MICO|nr:hypothetical protein [Microbacterium thalassium]MBB6390515.1 hypothetical protein [Microbacterium thalassium]GLK25626.1 hypothetical protein GCM10017607_29450 [Microbacterium thalassium]
MTQNVYEPDDFDPTGFDGTWVMVNDESTIWDAEKQEYVPEILAGQEITIRHEGDLQIYRIRVDIEPDLSIHMAYECRFGDSAWVPYRVVQIDGDPNHPRLQPNAVLKQGTRLNEPIAWIKQVYVDRRTQYRITKNPDGTAQYIMMRRLNEDGTRNVGTVLNPAGVASIDKAFMRIDA